LSPSCRCRNRAGRLKRSVASMVSVMPHFTIGRLNTEAWKVSDVARMKDLQEENARLKRIVANLTLEIDAVKTVLTKKYGGLTISERR